MRSHVPCAIPRQLLARPRAATLGAIHIAVVWLRARGAQTAARMEPLIGGKHYPFTPCGATKDRVSRGWMRGFSLKISKALHQVPLHMGDSTRRPYKVFMLLNGVHEARGLGCKLQPQQPSANSQSVRCITARLTPLKKLHQTATTNHCDKGFRDPGELRADAMSTPPRGRWSRQAHTSFACRWWASAEPELRRCSHFNVPNLEKAGFC